MANSRLEKIGSIYTRTKGLLDSGAMKWTDRPLWYDLYEAFPPFEEPKFDRPAKDIPLRKIFYHEDKIRAMFHQNNKNIGAINLSNFKSTTITQRFIDIYNKLEKQYENSASHEQIYEESIDMLKQERDKKKENDDSITLSSAFKEAKKFKKVELGNIDLKDIMKD